MISGRGDLSESHLVHTIQLRVGEKIDDTTEAMVKAFGLEYVLLGTPEIGHTSPGTMIHSLCTNGVASIISESGRARVFTALADYGDILKEGQVIGRLTDIDGSLISEVKSPIDGVVHTMYPARLVFPGDTLYTLLKVDEPTGWNAQPFLH